MLVLSRQRDETIMIGDHIEVTVVDVRGDKVRLGINAPTSVAVHRKEGGLFAGLNRAEPVRHPRQIQPSHFQPLWLCSRNRPR